jgi:protein-disulfide isomerase
MAETHEGHEKSHEGHHDGKKTVKVRVPKMGPTMLGLLLIVAIVVIVAGALMIFNPFKTSGNSGIANALSSQDAAKKAIDYINNNLVATGQTATFVSVDKVSGMYRVITAYQSQNIPVYITEDGTYLFVSQPLNTSQEIPKSSSTGTTTPQQIPKADKPVAQLFVMGFCPYGVQAENTMAPVVSLLGKVADIQIHFIASVSGTTVDSVSSLHGATEAQEDLRQVCIMKYYDQTTYWKYLSYMDNSCYGVINTKDATALDTCWKAAATNAGIDTSKISTCSSGSEGINLLKADETLDNQLGISGSPTLVINGVQYGGTRTSDAFKTAICSAFNTAPTQCSQTISANGTASAPTGGCG